MADLDLSRGSATGIGPFSFELTDYQEDDRPPWRPAQKNAPYASPTASPYRPTGESDTVEGLFRKFPDTLRSSKDVKGRVNATEASFSSAAPEGRPAWRPVERTAPKSSKTPLTSQCGDPEFNKTYAGWSKTLRSPSHPPGTRVRLRGTRSSPSPSRSSRDGGGSGGIFVYPGSASPKRHPREAPVAPHSAPGPALTTRGQTSPGKRRPDLTETETRPSEATTREFLHDVNEYISNQSYSRAFSRYSYPSPTQQQQPYQPMHSSVSPSAKKRVSFGGSSASPGGARTVQVDLSGDNSTDRLSGAYRRYGTLDEATATGRTEALITSKREEERLASELRDLDAYSKALPARMDDLQSRIDNMNKYLQKQHKPSDGEAY